MTKTGRIIGRNPPGREGRLAVGRRVAERRRELGLTQEALAFKAAVSHRTVQAIEAGENWPQPLTLNAIARALKVSADDLRDLADGQPAQQAS